LASLAEDDPLPDALAELVIARGAVGVILPDVKNEFIVSHRDSRTHGSSLLHGYVESDVECFFQSPQETGSQVVSGVSL
jgi:hypothetical protein